MSGGLKICLERIKELQDRVDQLEAENAQLRKSSGGGGGGGGGKGGQKGGHPQRSDDSDALQELRMRAQRAEQYIGLLQSRLDQLVALPAASASASSSAASSAQAPAPAKGKSQPAAAAAPSSSFQSTLSAAEKFALLKTIGEEIIEEKELQALLSSNKPQIVAYDGFEPSGRMHIAQGLIRAMNVNKFLKAGVTFKFWVADWFALMNQKLDGDLKKIQTAGELMIETWRACGLNVDHPNLHFLWSSKEINENGDKYWEIVLDIATKFNITRMKRCTQIMGREESDQLAASQIMYPVMQCADIFFLKVDICSLGVDQTKVNMLAREYCDKAKIKFKPVILSHHMLAGLNGEKMSKSDPDNAVFMDDAPADVKRKLKKAFCEPGNIEKNPVLEYVKCICMEMDHQFTIERSDENGGNKTYKTYEEVEAEFKSGGLHPKDLKEAVIKAVNRYLEPVQEHFKKNAKAAQLLKKVKGFKITK